MNQKKVYDYLKNYGPADVAELSLNILGDTEKKNLNLIRGYIRRLIRSKHIVMVENFQRGGNPKTREFKHMMVKIKEG